MTQIKLKTLLPEELKINDFIIKSSLDRLELVKRAFKNDTDILQHIDTAIKLVRDYKNEKH